MSQTQLQLEIHLYSLDGKERADALHKLHALLRAGQVALVPEQPLVNLHMHTFYSFNAYGYSPSAFAWESKKRGLYAAGITDHEVLGGVDEFVHACGLLGLRGSGGLETRVFLPEWGHADLCFPGEPGIFAVLADGFTTGVPPKGSAAEKLLQKMYRDARKRSEELAGRLNAYLGVLNISYENDVLPLVPEGGNTTERHILHVLDSKSRQVFPDRDERIAFWAKAMGVDREHVARLDGSPFDLQLLIRAKLMKRGGPCFEAEDSASFTRLQEAIDMVIELGGVPIIGWLDGTSEGERDAGRLLDSMMEYNLPAVNIIPDRNWNLKDAEDKRIKVAKFHEIIREARKRHLFIVVGSEMSKAGQWFADNFHSDEVRPFVEDFLEGARIITGHTRLRKHAGIGLMSPEVAARFKGDAAKRNRVFAELGAPKAPETPEEAAALEEWISKRWEGAE